MFSLSRQYKKQVHIVMIFREILRYMSCFDMLTCHVRFFFNIMVVSFVYGLMSKNVFHKFIYNRH